uniref:Inhibitor I9 domain-containing protein n=1 Tax=Bursaphelenchus xylophilus TaxID=6326 RepID=A0A1I7SEJ1_BURXY
MKFLIPSILCPLAIASHLKLNAHPSFYNVFVFYLKPPFSPSYIEAACEKQDPDLKPGVIQSKHINRFIVGMSPLSLTLNQVAGRAKALGPRVEA